MLDVDADISTLSDDALRALIASGVEALEQDRKENQILFYRPVSPSAMKAHYSRAKVMGVFGGNRASKTDTMFAEAAMLSTGMWPPELDAAMRPKFRGPMKIRVDVQSLTTALDEAILPKLRWSSWNGYSEPGGKQGHWGWIPRCCLIGGQWDKSWAAKVTTLRILCRDPDDHDHVLGESVWQFVSHNMDAADLASGEFDLVLHDEPPPYAHWRENRMRTLSRKGRSVVMMTWPDDPTIPVVWIFDEIWEAGEEGPNKDPEIDRFVFETIDNPNIDRQEVLDRLAKADDVTKAVRFGGLPITFAHRIHPLFTDTDRVWSFKAGRVVPADDGTDCVTFNHVQEFEHNRSFPTLFFLDPHPRKPHMMIWVQVDAADDLAVIAEAEVDGDPVDVRMKVTEIEQALGLQVLDWWRWGDPNMLRTPTSRREVLWIDEFRNAGLAMNEADDSDVGRTRVNEYLKPDPHTRRPRLIVHQRCLRTAFQLRRYSWDNHRRQEEKDLKQIPKPKNDDYPTLLKYCLNTSPTFEYLVRGAPIIKRGGGARGARA